MKEFFTREPANEGVKLPLTLPDGTPTEHYISVRGVDSDAFRIAEAEQRRKAVSIASIEDDAARLAAINESRIEMIASLVIGWSFPEDCSKKNILNFLREAPQIADQIDTVAGRRSLFFALKRSDSSDLPKGNGSSPQSRKARK
jgi:hypothetical protein